ncbi:hypothetical protein G9A89_018430 [Geosiphon pyriformis]|nr:hypothetical protein G9A89_018430 [Geosiphon pyriformis]
MNARDFEAAELEANHVQTVNLVINESSELDSKLKQFSDFINQKLEGYLADNCAIYQPPQQYNNLENTNHFQNQSLMQPPIYQPPVYQAPLYQPAAPVIYQPQPQKSLISNILPATITEDKSLAAIFSFKIEDPTSTPLFSRAVLEKKPITAMYTDAKIDGHSIKLILDSRSAGSIIIRQLINQLGY